MDKEKQAQYQHKWYVGHRKEHIARVEKYKTTMRMMIDRVKDVPCTDCGKKYPSFVMDLDHQVDKLFDISSYRKYGMKKLVEELKKCVVVCANCHRVRTHKK